MSEFIYYAKKKGGPNYTEEVVLEMKRPLTTEERTRLDAALETSGMEYVRVFIYNGEAPDFAGTVNV